MSDKMIFRLRCFCFAMGASYWGGLFILKFLVAKTAPKPSPFPFIAGYLINIAALVGAAMLAKRLNRNAWVWGIACFFIPGIFAIILALLGRAAQPFKFETSAPRASRSSWGAYGSYTSSKQCSRCGRSVSLSSRAGQSCPHCGAYWSSEQAKRI